MRERVPVLAGAERDHVRRTAIALVKNGVRWSRQKGNEYGVFATHSSGRDVVLMLVPNDDGTHTLKTALTVGQAIANYQRQIGTAIKRGRAAR